MDCRTKKLYRAFAATLLIAACSGSESPAIDQGALDLGTDANAAVDQGSGTPDMGMLPDVVQSRLDPSDYCEETVDVFCPFYLRCGRIAATDLADCERNFIETCNAAFEPQYAALAERGQLELSREGIDECLRHLETVECEKHVFDLDGPCGAVWIGQGASGDPCAPGIGSFVCGEGTECVLDLSLCGTCEAAGRIGEPCADNRCVTGATCIDGNCVARGLPGEPCDDVRICTTGASCDGGLCRGPQIVGVQEACDGARRCPYQSTCRGGFCVRDALLAEPCDAASCASGWCDGTVCRPFITPGDLCGESFQCLSGRCEQGVCTEPVSACFADT